MGDFSFVFDISILATSCYSRAINVSLTPELERWIEAKVKSGLYQTNSKVVREALRAMREREEKIAAIREKLDEAEADIQAGRVVPAEQLFDFIKSEVERHKQKV